MTIPSQYITSPVDSGVVNPSQKVGGVAIGITSATTVTAGNPITKVFSVQDQASESIAVRRTVVVDGNHTNKTVTAGTFAYDNPGFIIRTVATSINGVANNAIRYNGNENSRASNAINLTPLGSKYLTAHRANYWNPLGISGQRSNWDTAPTSMNVADFVDPTEANGTEATIDDAVGTRAVPGEITFKGPAPDPVQDEYQPKTGG